VGNRRIISSRPALAKLVRPCLKNKKAGGVAQVVEHLPSICEAQDSIPSTVKKKEKLCREKRRKRVLRKIGEMYILEGAD
jgi:hypothetical protein